MNIDALPHNQDWVKMQSWDLPPWKSKELMGFFPDLDAFRKLPIYLSAVEKGLIVNDRWKGPEKGYCKIREYKDIY